MKSSNGSRADFPTASAVLRAFADSPVLHERFEARADATPDAVAVVFEGRRLTYRELDRRANQVANRLQKLGVRPDTLVALSAERSLELVVGLLGIVKAGGAYVPMDPSYPKDRLELMLEDSGAKVLVTHASVSDAPSAAGLAVVLVEDTATESEERVSAGVLPEHLAYVIYTSGSTGRPKGVLVTHGNVVRLFEATDAWYGFGPADVWTLFHSCAFDFSVWEIWGALLHGGRLVVVPYWVSRSPESFHELLGTEGVTVLNQTPSAFRQLVHAILASPGERPLALRYVVFGGEALELQGLRPWFDRMGDERPLLVNMYGITETTVHVTYRPIRREDVKQGLGSVIGVPIPDLGVHLLGPDQLPVKDGETGEIYVEGAGLARGYLNRPELTAERFPNVSPPGRPPVRMYRSGDLARRLPGGELEYHGRIDHQVKIRGFRIELGEIESLVAEHPGVREVIVIAREDTPGDRRLVAYVAPAGDPDLVPLLRKRLKERLPEYMVPSAFVELPALPLTENGKVDRRALPLPHQTRPTLETEYVEPEGDVERAIAAVWQRSLRLDRVGAEDGFFDLGGSSMIAVESLLELRRELGRTVPVVTFFQHPTVRGLARALAGGAEAAASFERRARPERRKGGDGDAIAIIGVAGRFPGARNVEEYWKNISNGVESVRFFRDEELDPRVPLHDPRYVKARGVLEGADEFDAAFFGETAANAELMDPQQRVLLQVAVAALEDAGVVPERQGGTVGVFAGTGHNTYLLKNVVHRPDRIEALGELALTLGNDKDFVATRIAHKLNLKGPALSIHTACSTSLVAVCEAVKNLRNGDCDVALAGAASITVPQNAGHLYTEGAMLSADGHTRTFDAAATGTVFSDGAGMVVLKRLADAEKDGDRVYAVIRGAAVNNDGAEKASYTAPSVSGQASVVAAAHADAGVDPRTIGYVEAHGTATPLGDPVEVEALTQAFRARTSARGFCAIGSVKSNIGHLTATSGVAGLIKTALALHHGRLPASLHYEKPNPNIDFESTPFVVQKAPSEWARKEGAPRRAGVSSFGVGGTNAHVVVEEAPPPRATGAARTVHLFPLSAKSEAALGRAAGELAAWLADHPEAELADVAYTLQTRRAAYGYRRYVVAEARDELVAALRGAPDASTVRRVQRRGTPVAFLFPGQGTQYVGMGRALYESEPVFRKEVDRVAAVLRPVLGRDLREILFPSAGDQAAAEASLRQTHFTQPALFTIGYALASLYETLGVEPKALVGHSVGEFVAACLAGVFGVEDAATLVAQRGRLMQALPPGSMLSVRAPATDVEARLPEALSLAASNGPSLSVVSGPAEDVARFQAVLEAEGVACKALYTSHAFHSKMMDPAVDPFAELVAKVKLSAPRIPIVSTATGRWLTAEEATDPRYWARHLRVAVRFKEALETLWSDPSLVLVEVGPRGTSATLARQIAKDRARQIAIQTLEDRPELEGRAFARALGQLFLAGASVDWEALQAIGRRRLVSLPSYSFEKERHWLSPERPASAEPSVPRPPVLSSRPSASPVGVQAAPDAVLEEVLSAQLELMRAQLEALQSAEKPE